MTARTWDSTRKVLAVAAGVGLALSATLVPVAAGAAEQVVAPKQAAQTVVAKDVTAHGGMVTGKILNESDRPLRDVQLAIDHTWYWKNEFRPGPDNPSRTDFYTVPKEIPPHGSVTFQYRMSAPLPQRGDGHFETRVMVTGFAQVG